MTFSQSPAPPKVATAPDPHAAGDGLDRRALVAGLLGAIVPLRGQAQDAGPGPPAARGLAEGQLTGLIEARSSVAVLKPGLRTDVWTFGGRTPGTTLRLKPGEDYRARLVNGLDRPVSIHWHGVRLANAMDGVAGLTQQAVAPGASFDIRFTPPDAGTFIYRPLVIGSCGELQDRGLAGLFVVEDRTPQSVDREIDLIVDDWRLNEAGQPEPFGALADAAGFGRLGNLLTVNGLAAPYRETVFPGARLRLRLANICNARLMRVRFDGLKAWTIAVSGQPTDRFEPLRAMLPLYPGARYDVIVEVPDEAGIEAGVTGLLGAASAPLLALRTEGESAFKRRGALPAVAALGDNPLLPAAIRLQGATRADVLIQGGATLAPDGFAPFTGDPGRVWTVNGVAGGGFSGKPLVSVKRGTTVVLALVNRTAVPQALHLHGHVMRYLHPFDDGWEPYWLDTVLVPEGQTVRVAFLADNPGRWLLGSSVLERLDTGLAAWFQVT